jgi:hypothetical protein
LTSITWQELLRKQAMGTSTAMNAETHWFPRTQLHALSRSLTSA